jgi:hypothetical protein
VPTDHERGSRVGAAPNPLPHQRVERGRGEATLGFRAGVGARGHTPRRSRRRAGRARLQQGPEEGDYDQTPGMRRPQEGQRPSAPIR